MKNPKTREAGFWTATKHGPLIKSPGKDLPQDTQQEQSSVKGEDS
jgi:hypothetical protein